MIPGLPIEYACARVGARMAQRPDERLWPQLRSARTVQSLLEAVRSSPAASAVFGIALEGGADSIELAFRQQFRTRVDEVAGWAPEPWRRPIRALRQLIDLPAIAHLVGDEPPPRWMADDPVLAPLAAADAPARVAALRTGPWSAVVAALEESAEAHTELADDVARLRRRAGGGSPRLHRAILAWQRAWRASWPRQRASQHEALEEIVRGLTRHRLQFPALSVDAAAGARQSLAAWLAARVHRFGVQPATLLAYLALFALDLERLRAEFVLRARSGAAA